MACEFAEFAQARQGHLRRLAFLLCGDWHDAQDLTQTALLNLCRHWSKAQRADSQDGYARKVLINVYLTWSRKTRRDTDRVLDYARHAILGGGSSPAAGGEQPDLRLTLQDALAQLAPRGRAVLLLRYWEDMSVEATAAALGCSTGNVKSQSSRALARLREILGDSVWDGLAHSESVEPPASRDASNPARTTGPNLRMVNRP